MNKSHCNNCGKHGHINKMCKDPITSIGILCVRFEDDALKNIFLNKASESDTNINIIKHNSINNKFFQKVEEYNSKIKFLMIQRKHSLGFLEFIRGRYDVNDYKKIIKLFELMTEEEIDLIRDKSFDEIWKYLWKANANSKLYEDEYKNSKRKFEFIQNPSDKSVINLLFYTTNIQPKYTSQEWGFPKGRRNYYEKNVECALREFVEESSYEYGDISLVKSMIPLKEVFKGTDGVLYRHIYYIAVLDNKNKEIRVNENNNEVSNICWHTYYQAVNVIRNYHIEKKKVINELLKYIISVVEEDSLDKNELDKTT
jgi:8-oxo-dGTP pyrophosphatase MutT (NUDIX family)